MRRAAARALAPSGADGIEAAASSVRAINFFRACSFVMCSLPAAAGAGGQQEE